MLYLSGDPITLDEVADEHESRPRLVPATEDASLVSVALGRQMAEGPASPPIRIVHAEFAPWGEWPSSLGQEYQVFWSGGDSYAVAPAAPGSQPGLAALFYLPTGDFPSDMYLAPLVKAQAEYDWYPEGVQWDAWEPAWATALARGSSGHLAAYQLGLGGGRGPDTHLSLALVDATAGVKVIDHVACADARFPAETVPVKGGFLVATASGRPFGTCSLGDEIPGPADEIQVTWVVEATGELVLGATFQEPDPLAHIAHIALARRPEGAWLVWQSNGASAFQPPPVRAVRLAELGGVAGSVFQVTDDGETTGPIAAAALGKKLAVAWVDAADPSFPAIRVELFDEAGALVTSTSVLLGPAWIYEPSLSLLPSPDGSKLLLSWPDLDSSGAAVSRVRVARFTCAEGV